MRPLPEFTSLSVIIEIHSLASSIFISLFLFRAAFTAQLLKHVYSDGSVPVLDNCVGLDCYGRVHWEYKHRVHSGIRRKEIIVSCKEVAGKSVEVAGTFVKVLGKLLVP